MFIGGEGISQKQAQILSHGKRLCERCCPWHVDDHAPWPTGSPHPSRMFDKHRSGLRRPELFFLGSLRLRSSQTSCGAGGTFVPLLGLLGSEWWRSGSEALRSSSWATSGTREALQASFSGTSLKLQALIARVGLGGAMQACKTLRAQDIKKAANPKDPRHFGCAFRRFDPKKN